MGLFKQGEEISVKSNLLDLDGRHSLDSFYKNMDPGYGGFKTKYLDVIYAVNLKTIQALTDNYSNDLEAMDSEEHPNFVQFMNKSDLNIERFFNTAFRMVNKFIEHENVIIIPRVYFISYDKKYLESKDPVGILMNPAQSINIIRTDPLTNHDVDTMYKVSTYKVKNSEYTDYLKDLAVSKDPNNMRIECIQIGDIKRFIELSKDESRFIILLDKCKCLFNGYNDNKEELLDMLDKISSDNQKNTLVNYLKTSLADKQTYIFSRYEVFPHAISYSNESISIFSAGHLPNIKDLYLLEHGHKYEYYKGNEYVEVNDIRGMVRNSNSIEDRLPIVINKNGTNIQLITILAILVVIALVVCAAIL